MRIILTTLALLLAAYAGTTLQSLGFPDGHLTELELATQPLYQGLLGGNLAWALYFATRKSPHPVAIVLWLLTLGLFTAYTCDLSLHLDNGHGG